MTAVVVVGAQWGDEGKGKIVDIFTEHADMVVRYGGGPNAGHTLVVGNEQARRAPDSRAASCGRRPRACSRRGWRSTRRASCRELDELAKRGLVRGKASLVVSDRAHAILPYHVLVDGLREQRPDALGTTKRGVGPCYEDKAARRGVPLGLLRDLVARRGAWSTRALASWAPTIVALGGETPKRGRRDATACASSRRASCRSSTRRRSSSSGPCATASACSSRARRGRSSTSTTGPTRS